MRLFQLMIGTDCVSDVRLASKLKNTENQRTMNEVVIINAGTAPKDGYRINEDLLL